ncbi:MAG TPA: HEAT repeat domain-containing protein, partial [Pyrinomonadaceae bacterium]|nr:HEAT repeat domain-containing protein [Pyrinomonadaceae bacterium]
MIRNPKMLGQLSLIFFLSTIACVGGNSIAKTAPVEGNNKSDADDTQTQSATATIQSFNVVEGNDLMSKLESAQAKAKARNTPYWSAYAFDVRPGLAVDAAFHEFNGSINSLGDTSVMVGTNNGIMVETRNLAVFLLRDPSANQIIRMEVYNLERKREYSGYPVYWLGRANNEESLNYLRALVSAAPLDNLSERAVLGIALHDDLRVGGMLKNLIASSPNQKIRSWSIYWLGQVGGEQAFLASLVSNNAEDPKIRRQAAHAIGNSHDRGTMATLQQLFD